MKKDSKIREAIDESLCSVRFNAQDERAVMAAIRGRRVKAKKRARRLNLVYAMGLLLLLVVPVSAFTLHTRHLSAANIAAPGEDRVLSPDSTPEAAAVSPLVSSTSAPNGMLTELEAIQAARACFESLCDTSIFSFDEYSIDCQRSGDAYVVLMTSIYGNGCSFSVTVNALSGEIIHHSAAELATQPTYLSEDSPEVQSWYAKYGQAVYLWAENVQVEFSRRYEGATLRAAKDGDFTREQAQAIAKAAAIDVYAAQGLADAAIDPLCYPMLFSERAFDDGVARYLVVCGPDRALESNDSTDGEISWDDFQELKTAPDVLVMLNAQTGEVESVKHELSDADRKLMKGMVK